MTIRPTNAATLVGFICTFGLASALADTPYEPTEVIGPPVVQDMTALVELVTPATVFVLASDEFGQVLQGSGVVVRSDGWIATSFDLVSWTSSYEVQLVVDSRVQAYDASLARTYPALNLALLHIAATDLMTLDPAPPDSLRPGVRIFGAGYPTYNRLERGLRIIRGQLGTPMLAERPPRYPQLLAELLYLGGLSGSAVCTMSGELVGVLIGQDPNDPSLVHVLPADEVLLRVDAVAEHYIAPASP